MKPAQRVRFSREWLISRAIWALVLVPCACLSPKTEHLKSSSEAITAPGGDTTTPPPGTVSGGTDCTNPPNGGFAFCVAQGQSMHLGVSKAFSLQVTAASNYEGDISFTIDRVDLDKIDTKAKVATTLSAAQVHLR